MWFMTHTTSGERFYLSNDKPKYTVGRVGTDLELQNDNCVSRSHAVFHVTETENETYVELEDMGSKYGTFINKDIEKNVPLVKGQKTRLKNNDIVRFGRLQNIWKIQQLNVITITSALSADDVTQVTKNLKAISGKILNQWSPCCTHLTMNTPSVTVKLLHALIDQTHIVTTKYWEDLAKAVAQRQSQLPKPELYRPPFDEADVDVRPKPQRRLIFNGMTFIFLCRKHYDTYGPIVRAAGGACKDITSGVQKSFLIKNNVVVIQHIPSTQSQSSQTIQGITEILENHSRRIIPEYEIGLAIIKCSTQENCNPLYKIPESIPNTARSLDLSGDVNTQSQGFGIPETNVKLVTSTPYDMAPPNDSEDMQETMPNMYISETPVEQPKKRKHINVLSADSQDSDDEELFHFPKKSCNRNAEGEEPSNVSNEEQQQAVAKGARPIKRSMFACYNDNSETDSKIMKPSSPLRNDDGNATNNTNRKRPHIQVLGEEDGEEGDGDDLFCFGDTQTSKKKRTAGDEADDDLFAFKDSNKNDQEGSTENDQNEDSSEVMVSTQKFVVIEKPKPKNYSMIQVPKPKVLPRTISAIDWISGSLGKIKIKNENGVTIKPEPADVKNENVNGEFEGKNEDEDDEVKIKQEINGNDDEDSITEDHRKWLENMKNAIEIQEISLHNNTKMNERSHYRYRGSNDTTASLNGTFRNFKTFVKKYQPPSQTTSIQLHIR